MDTERRPADIDKPAAEAEASIRDGEAGTPAQGGGLGSRAVAAALLLAAALALAYQWPRIEEPFQVPPEMLEDRVVAQVDLAAIAESVALYRLGTGALPAALDEAELPPMLKHYGHDPGFKYATDGRNFSLSLVLPQWHIDYDSATGRSKARKTGT